MEIYGMLGERLGMIGKAETHDKAVPEGRSTPDWQKDFLQKPSISTRKGIAWGYNPPFEDTDTLVLTSPGSVFVDIRFPVKRQLGKPIASDPSFWAFSGSSSTTFLIGDGIDMPYSAHCVWKHDIDSKGPGITDEGDMFLLPNGDCMEVGSMENPQTGKVEMYKEYWTSPAAVKSSSGAGKVRLSPCIVAKMTQLPSHHEVQENSLQIEHGGVVIRIGNYCQGIMHNPQGTAGSLHTAMDAILIERWSKGVLEAGGNPEAPPAGWVQDWRSNTPSDAGIMMPCSWVCNDNRKVGDEIVVKGATWTIVEAVADENGREET